MLFGKKRNKSFGFTRKSSNFAAVNNIRTKMTLTANFWWWQSSELKNCESARRML